MHHCEQAPHVVPTADGRAPVIARRLRASWQRSERYGLLADELRPAFSGSVDTGSLLYECGDEVLRGLRATLPTEPISLMITDSEGLVLIRVSDDKEINRSLDRVHLAPGFYFAERDAGTNGLGLALADRTPSLVRAAEHYCTSLRGYTCAAAPIVDRLGGGVAGTVNLTTWSDTSSELLLALAQSAAANTTALMLARGAGRRIPPAPRGEVYRVYADRLSQPPAPGESLSPRWDGAVHHAREMFDRGRVVAVVGEPGVGKVALAALARRGLRRERLLNVRPPAPEDVEAWLDLWAPELGKDSTCVLASGVEALPARATTELARLLGSARRRGGPQPFALTARTDSELPDELRRLVDVVVEVPPLRYRSEDVLPLFRHFLRLDRGRSAGFTATAARALRHYDWPGNVRQLRRIVRETAPAAEVIDVHHLPPEVFTGPGRPLSRLQAIERDEIVRCLIAPGTSVTRAAAELGLSRATVYRKIAQYGIALPRPE
ncbi:GAF domain-containing protein [Saccharopolyspora sp. CA-218241]|uniref:GAF domain-containing protein n=1 Tax=Saccharopolyspora sp. CA-218241 TaxID=3240027 RepID=UPI003D974C6B